MYPIGYYTPGELTALGIEHGKDVLISKKVSLYVQRLCIGDQVRIDDFCILIGDIEIGSFVHIGAYTQLSGSSKIIIEDFCNLSSRVSLFSRSDDYSGNFMAGPMIDAKYTNITHGLIVVKKHVIVGSGSSIMPGVTLATGTAVGAASFINRDTDPWSIYAGVPAKKMKDRAQTILALEQDMQHATHP